MGEVGFLKPEGDNQAAGKAQETQPQAGRAVGPRKPRLEESGKLGLGGKIGFVF